MGNFLEQNQKTIIVATTMIVVLIIAATRFVLPSSVQPNNPPTPAADPVAQVSAVSKGPELVRTGTVENSVVVPVNSEYSGRIIEIYVKEGQAIKAGQALFKLEASAETAANQRAGTPDSYTNALNEYNRLQKLYEVGAIPRRQLENAAARLQEAKENSNNGSNPATSGALIVLNGPVTIKAPVDGNVTGLAASSGNTVQAGQLVLGLGTGQALEVVLPLEQNDLYSIRLGTPVTIEADGKTASGQVSSIFPEAQDNKVPRFSAHIKLMNSPEGLLKVGMPIKVKIEMSNTNVSQ